jgi:hypothetical protein
MHAVGLARLALFFAIGAVAKLQQRDSGLDDPAHDARVA